MNELEVSIIALIESLGNNVAHITYSTTSELWTIEYKNNLDTDKIGTDTLIEVLSHSYD